MQNSPAAAAAAVNELLAARGIQNAPSIWESPAATLIDDLGIDSFVMVEVLVTIEEMLGRTIDDDVIGSVVTVRDLWQLLCAATDGGDIAFDPRP